MAGSLNILIVSAECVPFAKSGGLGDVVGSLPQFLQKSVNRIIIVIPLYSFIDRSKNNISVTISSMDVLMGDELITCSVHHTSLNGGIPVFFIDHEPFFGRSGMYHDSDYNDYSDNPKRFAFFSKAALELCNELNFSPDIVHANDWHTALLPAYLKLLYKDNPLFAGAASILTIHNIAYQGRYDRYFYFYTGLPPADFTQDKFEHYNAVNFLKGGIYFADIVNTVSKGYASETRIPPGGYGLEYFLIKKGDDYAGILNGVDYSQWDPAIDPLLPANYSKDNLKGKSVCKAILQKQLGLEPNDKIAVIGIVSRLVEQKGFYILSECLDGIVSNMEVQFAILGSGDKYLEKFYDEMQNLHPGKVGAHIGYSDELAHLIEAGSDLFLMPSLYEPCGLNQIYSLKYGTLPIVRATGGLNDTVENYNQDTGEGTGFKFSEPSSEAIYNTVKWALDTYYIRRSHFKKLIRNAMDQHFSWEDSAGEYIRLYNRAISIVRDRSERI
jgi:starch synthase